MICPRCKRKHNPQPRPDGVTSAICAKCDPDQDGGTPPAAAGGTSEAPESPRHTRKKPATT